MVKNLVITLSENYLDKIQVIAQSLRNDGLHITNLYEFGVITGNADESSVSKLRQHKEIVSLTEDRQVMIAPPNSGIQ